MSLDQFIRLADNIVEFEADLSDNQLPVASPHAVEVHKNELKSNWIQLKTAYEKFILEAEKEEIEDDDKSDVETYKIKFKSAYRTYCNCMSKLLEMAQAFRTSLNARPEQLAHRTEREREDSSDTHKLHLPPIEIEIFYGDYSSWPTFRDTFQAVVSHTKASSVEKLFYLQQKTKGEAKEIVQRFPLTNQSFDLAWESLCSRYENKRILVNGQLKLLFNLQNIHSESGKSLKQLQRDLNSCISILSLHNIDVSSWDPIFVYIGTNKLPETTLTLWEQDIKDKTVLPKWSDLNEFLTNRYQTLESVSEIHGATSPKLHEIKEKGKTNPSSQKRLNSFQANVSGPKCQLCPKESHAIRKCPQFLQMNCDQRFAEIKREGLCINCFSKMHGVRNCSSKHCCFKCQRRHNTLLHREAEDTYLVNNVKPSLNPSSTPFTPSTSCEIQSTSTPTSSCVQSCFASHSKGVLLGTAWINICHSGLTYQARALVDSGSEGTFISERLCNLLKLPSLRTSAQISGLNNSVSAKILRKCPLILGSSLNSDVKISVEALVVPKLSSGLPSQSFPDSMFLNLPDIPLADPKFNSSAKIDILIGGDLFPSIVCSGIRSKVCESLIAQETVFGWILTGPVGNSKQSPNIVSHFCEISLEKEISRFWELENLPVKNFKSAADIACEELYIRTTKRNLEGRYIVSLPFKEGFQQFLKIGKSRSIAMAQFFRSEARLTRNPELKLDYDKVLQEYVDLGHMVKIKVTKDVLEEQCSYYLPHHAVIKPDSITTKIRVVFNASALSSNGQSLNSLLHTGPILQIDLSILILKWRFFEYVFNADIEKMYRQILVCPEHAPYQRILFRSNPDDPICDYELKTVTFGVNCAPYLAIRTLLQLADDVQSVYPLASDILRSSMYVDDVLGGSHTKQGALQAKNELIQALQSAGFSLRKWTSNSEEVLAGIPTDHLLREDFLKFECSSSAKTLGIRWNARSDEFFFVTNPFPESSTYSKREVLSQIAKLFDPAGWLSPCIILAKIIMQKIWISGTGWDEILSPSILQEWKDFQSNYYHINTIRIPRWIDYTPNSDIQIHGFCDASEKAYAASLYIRISRLDTVFTHLVASKTRVAPIKTISIPRLELCGAVLLAEMIENFLDKLNICQYSISCWTDSTIVLSWLAKPPCTWLTFVANRVSKITQIVDFSKWGHVDSESNPADLASRGLYPQDLQENYLWWHGPSWLKENSSQWPRPSTEDIPDAELEIKPLKVHFTYFSNYEDILERFSSFSKAVRVMAYVFRFFFRTHPHFRASFYKDSTTISSSEINHVRNILISVCQKASYPNEYKSLASKQIISRSSTLLNLNPFLDPEGIIRCCGRLESVPGLSYNEKHPVIIPYNSQLARLLTKFVHEISLHGGNQLVLRLIRMQYWIPKAKNLIKTTINKCKICVIYKKRCQKQIMANLPAERSEISRPFTHTGLDFAGPFDIKSYSGRACKITKGYVCLFVCFSTKAIHLEATSELTTQAFLAAFSRFVSRRGCPLHLHSDNGTTFVGASKVLAKEFIQTSVQRVLANYSHQNISWHFIPAGAPHMGGLWEAGVKSFKNHFRKVAGCHKYTFEDFSTLLSKIESCLNSRPISPISCVPTDLCALTPGHFLIGTALLAPIDPDVSDLSVSTANRWQKLKIIHQNFCTRWKNEYLRELQRRVKWQRPDVSISDGALVVIKDDNLPPNSWRLGRVAKVYPGLDNRVRVADVLTQRGLVKRPIVKLILLPSESN